jgi:uncharacterized protein YggE
MKKLITAAGVIFALSAQAGTIQITATGNASTKPEYVETSVEVISRCYEKSREAADATAKLAAELETVLKQYESKDLKDAYTQTGGSFSRQREAYYANNKEVELCPTGWRTSKTLSLKLKDIAKLPDLQDEVLNIVDRTAKATNAAGAQTWASWSAPQPSICAESRVKLADAALKDAVVNARREFAALAAECNNLVNPKLVAIGLPGVPQYSARARSASYESADMAGAPGGSGSTFTFGSLSESVTRSFTFEFDGGAEECKIPTPAKK